MPSSRFDAGEATRITIIGSTQDQPHTQDPLGLTFAQWQADPRQADPVTTLFNTNKTIRQYQGGRGDRPGAHRRIPACG